MFYGSVSAIAGKKRLPGAAIYFEAVLHRADVKEGRFSLNHELHMENTSRQNIGRGEPCWRVAAIRILSIISDMVGAASKSVNDGMNLKISLQTWEIVRARSIA
ncbi:MAG: hypothetical protein U0Y68_20740 [Blastocatellia bacterium]